MGKSSLLCVLNLTILSIKFPFSKGQLIVLFAFDCALFDVTLLLLMLLLDCDCASVDVTVVLETCREPDDRLPPLEEPTYIMSYK